jgi:hypothetical protein
MLKTSAMRGNGPGNFVSPSRLSSGNLFRNAALAAAAIALLAICTASAASASSVFSGPASRQAAVCGLPPGASSGQAAPVPGAYVRGSVPGRPAGPARDAGFSGSGPARDAGAPLLPGGPAKRRADDYLRGPGRSPSRSSARAFPDVLRP